MAVPPGQAAVADFLAGLAGEAPVETHISAVFRGRDTVWKLKKAVRLAFLDFEPIEARRRFLERELTLNAPFVPGLYRDVVPITVQNGAFSLGGSGPAVDWVLRMARVPAGDFLDRMATNRLLETPLLLALADQVAAMHAAQAPTGEADALHRIRAVAEGNAAAARSAGLEPGLVAAWEAGIDAALTQSGAAIQARGPLVRRCHGDLHLGNLLMWRGQPAPFDALEFDEGLATIDPGYDLAFLLMDLDTGVSRAAANLVMARYVARTGDTGLLGPLAAFLSLRAMIRAHVQAARGGDGSPLLRAAMDYLQPSRAVVVAVGGLMGTGKTTLARAVAPSIGPAPGALVVRSDEIRKRLHGVAPEQPLPESAYAPDANQRTNAAFIATVREAACAGHAVVADATFLSPTMADGVAAAARAAGVPFLGVWLDAPLPELERRVAARRGDASDANVAVLRAAAVSAAPPPGWVRIDALDRAMMEREVQRRVGVL